MNTIERIKKEIEKRISGYENACWEEYPAKTIAEDFKELLSFIESLEKEQDNPYEWSEKDEHCIELLDIIIDSSALIPKNRTKCHNFLKSLSPSWKPSKE